MMNSKEHILFLRNIKRSKIKILLTQLFLILFFFIGWELLYQFHIINSFLFSSPSLICKTIIQLAKEEVLFQHIGITFYEIFISFFLSVFLGIMIATILWWSPFLAKVMDPYLTILNSLPKVALGPLIIIWFGANMNSIIFMSLLISLFVTIINIYHGFISVPNHYLIMIRSFGANKWKEFFMVVFPYNRNTIISTLKVNISMNLIGVVMGELLVSKKGLGYLIQYGSQVFHINLVITCVFLLGVISYFLYTLIQKIK